MIGRDLHVAAIVGASNLIDSAEELALDISWLPGTSSNQSAAGPTSSSQPVNEAGSRVKFFCRADSQSADSAVQL